MSEPAVIHQMENWGYYLLPRSHPHSPGHTGLLVAIRETPTEMHFDPESMRLKLADEDGTANWTTLSLRWFPPATRRVSLGRVILRDRVDERVQFFSFGASLERAHIPGETVYSLRSRAPVLEITGPQHTVPDQLAFETEVMLAELEARWIQNEEGFTRRLAKVEPFELYTTSLQSILVRYRQSQPLREVFQELFYALIVEKSWLVKTAQWPAMARIMEDLLEPC